MENNTENGGGAEAPAPTSEEVQLAHDSVKDALVALQMATTQLESVKNRMRGNLSTALGSLPLGATANLIATTKLAIEKAETEFKGTKETLSYCLEVAIPERFKREEIKTFNTDDFRVTISTRVMASIVDEERENAYQWLRDNGYDSIIKETVNASTMSATAKEIMENGRELPDDMFRTFTKDGTSITKKR